MLIQIPNICLQLFWINCYLGIIIQTETKNSAVGELFLFFNKTPPLTESINFEKINFQNHTFYSLLTKFYWQVDIAPWKLRKTYTLFSIQTIFNRFDRSEHSGHACFYLPTNECNTWCQSWKKSSFRCCSYRIAI